MARIKQVFEFIYDTNDDPEIDKLCEDLAFAVHSKSLMIRDSMAPQRTIVVKDTPEENFDKVFREAKAVIQAI